VSEKSFVEQLDAAVMGRSMLSHPFYQAWTAGKLDRSILQEYVKQYFAHVKAFPTYVSGVHSQMDDLEMRQLLLENLIEEEQGENNHPELWLRFAEGLGVDRKDVMNAELLEKTKESVATFRSLTRENGAEAGLAALYAYESQIPEVAKTKRAGLKEFYSLDDDRSVAFFTVHETADVYHSATERKFLAESCQSDEQQSTVVDAAAKASGALWHFLDGVYEAYVPETVKQEVMADCG
jgi:pyrroloquinoline-quinone synthase